MLVAWLATLSWSDPSLEVGGGAGLFSPLRAPWQVGPVLDGQADLGGFVGPVPQLAASLGIEGGFWPAYLCEGCGYPVWKLSLGPTWQTEWLDVSLFARIVGAGASERFLPTVQATGRIGLPASLQLRPWLAFDSINDVSIGTRVSGVVWGDGTRTRPRQCTEGDRRTLDEPVQQSSLRGALHPGPDEVDWDYGDAYLNEELKNGLGDMKDQIEKNLAVLGAAQSAYNLASGEAEVADIGGRVQDTIGQVADQIPSIANQDHWTDWSVPLTPDDIPGSLATNYLEIGKRAIDALIPLLERQRNQFLFGVTMHWTERTTTYECVPVQVCHDGWWETEGWTPRGPASHTDRKLQRSYTIPDGPPASVLRGVWDKLLREYARLGFDKHEQFEFGGDPCAMGDHFDPGAEVASGPSQADCEDWLSERNALQSERRALVGSSLDLLADQLEWEQERARNNCDHAREMAEHYEESASKQAEIARLTGSWGDFAKHEADRAADWRTQADRDCQEADDVGRHLDQTRQDIAGRPERIEQIDQATAELDAKIAECELIE